MGLYRLLLAYCVVIEHLAEGTASISHTGMFAVFGFYVLSGFLITRALNDVYAFDFTSFWSNRLLRLYPPYFIVLAVALLLVLGTPGASTFFPAVWKDRPGPIDWFAILTIVPMGVAPMGWSFRPVPSVWSVGVELLNYAALYAIVARRKEFALITAFGAAAFHILSLWRGDPLGDRYFPFHAALLPFALGALIYFYTRSTTRQLLPRTALLLCIPALGNCVIAGALGGASNSIRFEALFYLNLAFQCLAVLSLSQMSPVQWEKLDKWLGDLAYPVFLSHWLVGYVITMTILPDQMRGLGLMFATLVATTGVAYVICRIQDLIEPWRSRIRAEALDAKASSSIKTAF